MEAAYIAIDWGSSARRAYLLTADGGVIAEQRNGAGVTATCRRDYAGIVADLRRGWGVLPVLASGMVGSRLGWVETCYVAAPAGASDLAAAALSMPEDHVVLLPGVCNGRDGRADVMRGEEIHALGAVISGAIPADSLLCQPGTHNKWIRMEAGRIADFTTVMTGELFAALNHMPTLAPFLKSPAEANDAFRSGVDAARTALNIGAALFAIRAGSLLGSLPEASGSSYASGLLIGSDLLVGQGLGSGEIAIVAADGLSTLYVEAAGQLGIAVRLVDAGTAFVNGIHAIASQGRNGRPMWQARR